ncbi:unnamed protein product [Choristocarpus tenellus]
MVSLLETTEKSLAGVLRLCSVSQADVDAIGLHDEATIALLNVDDDDAIKALGAWLVCLGTWRHESHIDEKIWPIITRPHEAIVQESGQGLTDADDPDSTFSIPAIRVLMVVLFRCMLLGHVDAASPHRTPSPAAWAAVRGYLGMLALPGATSYGVFQPALFGLALTNIRSWCRNSSVYRPGAKVHTSKDGGNGNDKSIIAGSTHGRDSRAARLKRRRGRGGQEDDSEGGNTDEEDKDDEEDESGTGARRAGVGRGGGRRTTRVGGAGGDNYEAVFSVPASINLLRASLSFVPISSHQVCWC